MNIMIDELSDFRIIKVRYYFDFKCGYLINDYDKYTKYRIYGPGKNVREKNRPERIRTGTIEDNILVMNTPGTSVKRRRSVNETPDR